MRLRPILMTSIAFIAGVFPLVISEGAGSEMRQAMGVAVFAGMIGVTIFGLFLTPVFYVVLMRWGGSREKVPTREKSGLAPGAATGTALLLLFTASTLHGAVGPNYKKPETTLPAGYKAEELGTWKTAEPRDHVAKGKWWEIFDDPVLNELQGLAAENNQSLKAAF